MFLYQWNFSVIELNHKLNELNHKFTTCHNVTIDFLKEDKNFKLIKYYFHKYYNINKTSFSKIFPNYYLRNNKHGIKNCVFSKLVFQEHSDAFIKKQTDITEKHKTKNSDINKEKK